MVGVVYTGLEQCGDCKLGFTLTYDSFGCISVNHAMLSRDDF